MISWKTLNVCLADDPSESTQLGKFLTPAPHGEPGDIEDTLDAIKYLKLAPDGSLASWDQHFVFADDEEPDWDTPAGETDWSGFREAIERIIAESEIAAE